MILAALLIAGLLVVIIAFLADPDGMVGSLSAEAAGVLIGAGVIESLLLLDDRRRESLIAEQRGSAIECNITPTG
jgi:hypothetical protein